jgi:ubiquinone biosynthesis protein
MTDRDDSVETKVIPGSRDAGPGRDPWAAVETTPLAVPVPEPPDAPPEFEVMEETPVPGLLRRLVTTQRHLAGMLSGALVASVRSKLEREKGERPRGPGFAAQRALAALVRPLLARSLRDLPFPVQFRRRLEILGPTYIKLGQILSLREDVLPRSITTELKNLLDRLPVVPFSRILELITEDLKTPVEQMFASVDPRPLGSASIAQTHRATTVGGDEVILKVVKPGIRETLRRDAILLRLFGSFLQLFLGRYQPKRIIAEFTAYTAREVDMRREANNAESFRANFKDIPDVVFPRIWREYSGSNVLCMEYLVGMRPDDPRVQALSDEEKQRLIDLGAASIIRMLYGDGFFHADLHPANLIILPGTRCGFIDLGMVGRFEDDLRRTMLYYYYCLVMGDTENAARYLQSVADPGPGADPTGFRREVEEIGRRWVRAATFESFSLAQLILESVSKAGQYRMYFPVELVLMTKALITFEGVGQILKPGFDVAAVSRTHINRIFLSQFNPLRIVKESLRGAPEMLEAMVKAPLLVTEGLRFLEKTTRRPPENPLTGLRGTLLAGASIVAGAVVVSTGGPWPLWVIFFLLAAVLALRRGG